MGVLGAARRLKLCIWKHVYGTGEVFRMDHDLCILLNDLDLGHHGSYSLYVNPFPMMYRLACKMKCFADGCYLSRFEMY